jgi:hypothetical protein
MQKKSSVNRKMLQGPNSNKRISKAGACTQKWESHELRSTIRKMEKNSG